MPVILHPEDEQKCLQQALLHQFAFPCVVNLIATKTPPYTAILSLFQ